jgi:hypothetical protein
MNKMDRKKQNMEVIILTTLAAKRSFLNKMKRIIKENII